MAYSTGSASTLVALLDALRVALIAEGWTIHRWDDTWLAAQPAGGPLVFHWVISAASSNEYPAPRLHQSASTSYDGGSAWDAQPGQPSHPGDSFSESWVAPFGVYHLFVGSDYAHLVTRADDGMWRHALSGMMDAASSAPAAYLQYTKWLRGNSANTHRADSQFSIFPWGGVDGTTSPGRAGWFWLSGVGWQHLNAFYAGNAVPMFARGEGLTSSPSLADRLRGRAANQFNMLSPLIPLAAGIYIGSGIMTIAGHARDVRLVKIDYLQVGEVVTIGGDEWLVFPAINRGYTDAGSMIPASGMIGYAYRRSIT